MSPCVLITGCNGGIGASLCRVFAEDGWTVIGVDRSGTQGGAGCAAFIKADLAGLCRDATLLRAFAKDVRASLAGRTLRALINNAALQIVATAKELSVDDVRTSMDVNVVAPFLLVKEFFVELEAAEGVVVNIGSVHAEATKPKFSAYAASKAALHGLTRALAVELGPKVRVVTLAPAATATEMLKSGFDGDPAGLAALNDVHPLKRIADPDEIARLALFLASKDAAFLTGATIYADGGVLSRLHDPG